MIVMKQSERVIIDKTYIADIHDRGEVSLIKLQIRDNQRSTINNRNYIFKSDYVKSNLNNENIKEWILLNDNKELEIITEEYFDKYKSGWYSWSGGKKFINSFDSNLSFEEFDKIPLERFVLDDDCDNFKIIYRFDGHKIHRNVWIGYIGSMICSGQYDLHKVKGILSLNPKILDLEIVPIPWYNQNDRYRGTEGIEFRYNPDQQEFEELSKIGDFDFAFNLMKQIKLGLESAKMS